MIRRLRMCIVLAALSGADASVAEASGGIDVGALFGIHEPLEQDDATNDGILGARIRVPVSPGLKVELGASRFDMDSGPYRVRGIPQEVQTWTLTGLTGALTFGGDFNATRVQPFATVGSGLYFLRKNERADSEELGVFGSVGVNFSLRDQFSADVAATATRINLENGGSRALVSGQIVLNYHLGRR